MPQSSDAWTTGAAAASSPDNTAPVSILSIPPGTDAIDTVRGMDVIVTTTANSDDEARELLRLFGFPFPQEQAEEKEAA